VNKNVRLLEISEGVQLPTIHVYADESHVMEHLRLKYSSAYDIDQVYEILFSYEETWMSPDNSVWIVMDSDLPVVDHRYMEET
jgi:hypothetical protein